MKILYIAPYLPSPLRVRPYRLIQHLSKEHEITVVSLLQPAWTSRFITELKSFCKEVHAIDLNKYSCFIRSILSVPTTKPMSVAYFSSKMMASLIRHLIQENNYTLIHTEFIRAAPYTANITGIPKLFDAVDSLTLAYERGWRNRYGSLLNRTIAFEEWLKMRSFEPMIINSFDRVIVSSSVDQKYLAQNADPDIEVLPNGVDNKYYYMYTQKRDKNSIVFVGQMNYYVNVESVNHFYNTAFKIIRKHIPDIRFTIVGADPKKSICNLAKDSAVEVTGYVPDIRPYMTRASIFICPMVCGSGIQNKLLHAMAMGTPVVTTSIAIQALKVNNDEHLLVADEAKQFAEAVLILISNHDLQKRLSENARRYILENHDWDLIGLKLETIYEHMQ